MARADPLRSVPDAGRMPVSARVEAKFRAFVNLHTAMFTRAAKAVVRIVRSGYASNERQGNTTSSPGSAAALTAWEITSTDRLRGRCDVIGGDDMVPSDRGHHGRSRHIGVQVKDVQYWSAARQADSGGVIASFEESLWTRCAPTCGRFPGT